MRYVQGQRVNVITGYPTGPGTIHDVYGGPTDDQYRVLMDEPGEDGLRIYADIQAWQAEPAPPIVPYAVGDRVTYQGRLCLVTDADERDVYLLAERDPPELWSDLEHEYIWILPHWKLHAYTR